MSATYSLDLFFMTAKVVDELPGEPIAHVRLKTYTQNRYGKMEGIFLTPQCITLREFQHHLGRLRKELDVIEKEAVKKFAAGR